MPKINACRGTIFFTIGSSPPSAQHETRILDSAVVEGDQLLTDCAMVYPNVMESLSPREGADQYSRRPQFMSMPFKLTLALRALWLFMLIT